MPCTDVMESSNFVVFAVENSINDKIYPQYADFTFYGGLYRDVNLICVPDAHFDLTYHGAPGIKVTPVIDGANANVDIEVWTKNAQGKALTYIITDREGAVVAETTTADTKVSFTLENVRKWNGRIDPYLYTATVKLEDLDTVSARFGCRSYEIDPDRGFIRKVSEPNPDYILKEKGAVLNWWDITEIPGYASLNTKLAKVNEAAGLDRVQALLKPIIGEAAQPQVLTMLNSMSVLRMVNLLTGSLHIELTKEILMDLNAQLNKIAL